MAVHAVAHLNFRGEAREALEFYRSVFGGDLRIATYGDFGMPQDAPGADHVVFGHVVGENGFQVMAYDVPGGGAAAPVGETTRENGTTITTEKFFLSAGGDSVDEVGEFWKKLSEDATVIEPFGPSPWAPAFGMLRDRFGVTWILQVAA
ncbi:VOC family protein [Amycolatopsis sp. FU40]|uniref:VOC family protein n=1 Tax=Amycolatopsis sp. FU40 TaxID=2914159 RepID=UPI001F33388D|nr:VOC family protein [Amycolatopsis sp. FU40]UKD51764.1 VOC family protein [Amycolatopsis sp. FU40]